MYPDQVQWFIDTARTLVETYGHIPALAFFHIPRSEYSTHTILMYDITMYVNTSTGYEGVYKKTTCFGMNDDDVTPQIQANGTILNIYI